MFNLVNGRDSVIGAGTAALVMLLWATLAVVRILFRHCLARGHALQTLVETDVLTGLPNRRYFAERFTVERTHTAGENRPLR